MPKQWVFQRPKVCPEYAWGAAKTDRRLEGPQQAAWASAFSNFSIWYFFSYSWPGLHALWPPAISQDPVAKTVGVGCRGVQCGSRPVPHSVLTHIKARHMHLPTW